jgi:hypothetical protein
MAYQASTENRAGMRKPSDWPPNARREGGEARDLNTLKTVDNIYNWRLHTGEFPPVYEPIVL